MPDCLRAGELDLDDGQGGQDLFFPPVCGSYGVSSPEGTAFQWSKREADSHSHLLPRSRMCGALTPFSHTSSCRSAYSQRKSNTTSAMCCEVS